MPAIGFAQFWEQLNTALDKEHAKAATLDEAQRMFRFSKSVDVAYTRLLEERSNKEKPRA